MLSVTETHRKQHIAAKHDRFIQKPRESKAGSYQKYIFSYLYLEPLKEGPVTTLLLR